MAEVQIAQLFGQIGVEMRDLRRRLLVHSFDVVAEVQLAQLNGHIGVEMRGLRRRLLVHPFGVVRN